MPWARLDFLSASNRMLSGVLVHNYMCENRACQRKYGLSTLKQLTDAGYVSIPSSWAEQSGGDLSAAMYRAYSHSSICSM